MLVWKAARTFNGQDDGGRTALMLAVRHRQQLVVERLLEFGGDVIDVDLANKHGRTPIMWAVQNDDVSLVHLLAQRGANISLTLTRTGETLLDIALRKKFVGLSDGLMERGLVPSFAVSTFAHVRQAHNEALFEGLVNAGGVDFVFDGHPSPLFAAAASGNGALAAALLADGANCSATNSDSQPPSDVAHQNGHEDLRDLLVLKECAPPLCPAEQQWSAPNKACECIDENKELSAGDCVPKCGDDEIRNAAGACISAELNCRLMDKVYRPDAPEADNNGCNACPAGTYRHFNECRCTGNRELVNGVCVPKCGGDETRHTDGNCILVAELNCRLMDKVHRPGDPEADENNECKDCPEGTQRHLNDCWSVCDVDTQDYNFTLHRCVPKESTCHEMGKIRNDEFMCESCSDGEQRHGNSCVTPLPSPWVPFDPAQ